MEVIYELFNTEREYVRDLEIIIDIFVSPLRRAAGSSHSSTILSAKDISSIFGNIEILLPIHEELLKMLEAKFQEHTIVEICGDCILKVADYFKV